MSGLRSHALQDSAILDLKSFLILIFPRFDLGGLAWVALVPLLVSLEGKGLKQAFLLGYAAGLVMFTGIFYWIWFASGFNLVNYVLLAVYVSLYTGVFGFGLNWARGATGLSPILIAPPLWVTLEYARAHAGFLSSPWMLLGHSQYQYPSLMQITAWTGVSGLSFLIVLVNAGMAETMVSISRRGSAPTPYNFSQKPAVGSLLVAVLLVAGTALYGFSVLEQEPAGERVSVALIQGNIPPDHKWDASYRRTTLDRYADLTRKAAQESPKLIVWPETAVPGDVLHTAWLRRSVGQLAIDTGSYLLVGSAEGSKFTNRNLKGKSYNSMVLFAPTGTIAGEYRKIGLVPFGEYQPLRGIITWPKMIASASGNIVPGDEVTVFTVGPMRFGVTICWENIFSDLFREFVKRGARFMVNATNEAMFGETAFPYQLLTMSAFRAAENRVAIARVGNSGISAFIDPFGRITSRLQGPQEKELFIEGVLNGQVVMSHERTFYTEYGDVFAFVQMAFCALMVVYASTSRRIDRLRRAVGARSQVAHVSSPRS